MKTQNRRLKSTMLTDFETRNKSVCERCSENNANFSLGFFEAMAMIK